MTALMLLMSSLILGAFLVTGIAVWVSAKSPLLRNIAAFCLAGVSAYSIGFVLDMHRLVAAGNIPAGNVAWPAFTWLAIAFACLVAAFQTGGSLYMLATPFLINALLALLFASSMHEIIFVAAPLCLASVVIFLYRRGAGSYQTLSFLIDSYRLDAPVSEGVPVSQSLFALERRFERRALYVFTSGLLGVVIAAIANGDWRLVGIGVAATFLNGLIGRGLEKNRQKSFSQLAAGSAGETEMVMRKPDEMDFDTLTRSMTKFMGLVVLTAAMIAYNFNQPWWIIVGVAIAAFATAFLLVLTAVGKTMPT